MQNKKINILFKFFKRIFLFLLISFTLIVLGVSVYIFFERENIKSIFIRELNNILISPISLKDVEINFAQSFPKASIKFIDVVAYGPNKADKEHLLKAKSISLRFRVSDIFNRKFKINEIVIEGGNFNLKRYNSQQNNYVIWRKLKTETAIDIRLEKLIAKNVFIRYRDLSNNYDYQIHYSNMEAKADIFSKRQIFNVEGKYHVHSLAHGDKLFLYDKEGEMDVLLRNDAEKRIFTIKKAFVDINKLPLNIHGLIDYKNARLDLEIALRNIDADNLLKLFSDKVLSFTSSLNLDLNIDVNVRAKGNFRDGQLKYLARIRTAEKKKGNRISYKIDTNTIDVDDLKFDMKYSNSNNLLPFFAELEFSKLSFTSYGLKLSSNKFSISNFSTPKINCEFDLLVNLKEFCQKNQISNNDINANLTLEGNFNNEFEHFNIKEWKLKDFKPASFSGEIGVSDFVYSKDSILGEDGLKVNIDTAHLRFNERYISTNNFKLYFGNMESNLRFYVDNYFKALFDTTENLYINANLNSDHIDINYFNIKQNLKSQNKSKANSFKDNIESLFERLYLDLNLAIGKFVFSPEKDYLSFINADMYYSNNKILLENFNADIFNGHIVGNFSCERRSNSDLFAIRVEGNANRISISDCFRVFNNFGQTTLTHNNISGAFSSTFDFSYVYNFEKGIDVNSVSLIADVHVADGRLQNISSLYKVAKFTGENNLQDIKFADLFNKIKIEDRNIEISKMHIVSDALNLYLQGTHSFENKLNYKLNIEFSELLSRKHKDNKKITEFGVEDLETARLMLPLIISGYVSDLKIRYDFEEARSNMRKRRGTNMKDIKNAIRSDFGLGKLIDREKSSIDSRNFVIDMDEVNEDLFHENGKEDDSVGIDSIEMDKIKSKKSSSSGFIIEFEDE